MKKKISLLVLCSLIFQIQCKKKSDEDILREKLDTAKVHLYLGLKQALADKKQHKNIMKLVDNVLRITDAARDLVHEKRTGESGASAKNQEHNEKPQLTAAEVLDTVKTILKMKKNGAELLRTGKDKNMAPILPVFMSYNEGYTPDPNYNTNIEHALFASCLWLVKFHPKTPVPVPPEILLYEASRIDTDELKEHGIAQPFHALRSYIYATNELCNLAEKESKNAFTVEKNSEKIQSLTNMLAQGRFKSPQWTELQIRLIYAFFESLGHGSVSLCFFNRGEEEKGREALNRFLDSVEGAGLKTPETSLLRAYVYCAEGKNSAPMGIERLNDVLKMQDLDEDFRKECQLMMGFCKTSAGTSSDILRKISFYAMLYQISFVVAKQSGLLDYLQETEAYAVMKKIGGGIDSFLGFAKKPPVAKNVNKEVKEGADKLKEKSKDFFKKFSDDD